MKKLLYLFIGILLVCSIYQACTPDVEVPGSIYGVVADKATGEPIKSAGVELSPSGLKTITGSEGQFQFDNLAQGSYTLLITKTGYSDYASSTITVQPGQTTKVDVQIEKLPPALKVVNDNREEISTLDFGSSVDDVARSFSLFNDGTESLEWQITVTADWIKSVSKTEGILSAGNTQSLIVTLDRTKLKSGNNTTTAHITSNNGSKQLTILALGEVVTTLNSLPATDIKGTSVTLNGEILIEGNPKYNELGFVYSDLSMPTVGQCIKKITVPSTNDKNFSATITDLTVNKTYYARAYAIQDNKEVYSTNEVIFVPKNSPGKVKTIEVKCYSATLVKFKGEIIEVGNPTYSECGFVFGTNSNPTLENDRKVIAPHTGKTGVFEMSISDPDFDVISYVRAYIINGGDITYGDALTFKANSECPRVSKPTITDISPSKKQAVFNSYVTNIGTPIYTECGFVYNTSSNPTIENGIKLVVSTNGGGGNYSLTVSDLVVNTEYYVCAFITSPIRTFYSEVTQFVLPPISPIIETLAVTNLTETSAILNGIISTVGEPAYTERGFCLSKSSSSPTIVSSKSMKYVVTGNGTGNYSLELNNLEYNTEYYYRTYSLQSSVVTYGKTIKFTTLP